MKQIFQRRHCERSAAIQSPRLRRNTARRGRASYWIAASLTLLAMTATTAYAQTPPERKPLPQQQASIPPRELTKQETVTLGNNRFLIISGSAASNNSYGYTIDLVKIDAGVPHFDPLFIEEYNTETNTAHLEYGIAFMATSYAFDKAYETLTYTTEDRDTHTRYQLTYKLDVDIFKLQSVVSQTTGPCPKEPCIPAAPKTVYTAPANAQAH